MSAFIIEDEAIDYMLTAAVRACRWDPSVYIPSRHTRQKLGFEIVEAMSNRNAFDVVGQALIDQNYLSVNHRYNDDAEPHQYRYREHVSANGTDKTAIMVQALKCAACFDYQACETDDYDATDAAHIIRDLRSIFIAGLPGYDDAKWGGPEHPVRHASGAPSGPVSLLAIANNRH